MDRDTIFEQLIFNADVNAVKKGNSPVKYPVHWHKDVEIMIVPEDVAHVVSVSMNQTRFDLKAGDVLIIWPGDLHEIIHNPDSCLVVLQFPITILNERKDFAIFMNIFKNCRYLPYDEDPERNQNLMMLFQQILSISYDSSRFFRNVETIILLYEVFISLGQTLRQSVVSASSQGDKMTEKIFSTCEYIRENCDKEITLETAAEYAGFSPCYFSRFFKKVTSYNFVQFLTIQRVKRLQVLLANDSISVADAAEQAGFKSISTLNRVFRQYSGCSPSEYRKFYRN